MSTTIVRNNISSLLCRQQTNTLLHSGEQLRVSMGLTLTLTPGEVSIVEWCALEQASQIFFSSSGHKRLVARDVLTLSISAPYRSYSMYKINYICLHVFPLKSILLEGRCSVNMMTDIVQCKQINVRRNKCKRTY